MGSSTHSEILEYPVQRHVAGTVVKLMVKVQEENVAQQRPYSKQDKGHWDGDELVVYVVDQFLKVGRLFFLKEKED